jgi:hypothetical protein
VRRQPRTRVVRPRRRRTDHAEPCVLPAGLCVVEGQRVAGRGRRQVSAHSRVATLGGSGREGGGAAPRLRPCAAGVPGVPTLQEAAQVRLPGRRGPARPIRVLAAAVRAEEAEGSRMPLAQADPSEFCVRPWLRFTITGDLFSFSFLFNAVSQGPALWCTSVMPGTLEMAGAGRPEFSQVSELLRLRTSPKPRW